MEKSLYDRLAEPRKKPKTIGDVKMQQHRVARRKAANLLASGGKYASTLYERERRAQHKRQQRAPEWIKVESKPMGE